MGRQRPFVLETFVGDRDWALGVAAALAMLALVLFDPRVLNDGDTYWHLAAGQWMLDHGQVPHTDPFSFTRAGAPWAAHEWLSEIAMAVASRLGGWAALLSLFGLSITGTTLLLTGYLRRWLTGVSLGLTLVLAMTCVLPSLLARPHLLVLPIVVAWTAGLLTARQAGRAPSPWLNVLMLVWANLHGSYVFGFLILGSLALEALVEAQPGERWRTARSWGVFALVGVLAATITPQGVMGLVFPFKLMTMSTLGAVTEWRASDFTHLGPFEMAIGVTMFVVMQRGVRLGTIRILLILLLLHMALQHMRHVMILAMVAPMLVAEPLSRTLDQGRPTGSARRPLAWIVLAALAPMLIAARAAEPTVPVDGPTTPVSAVNHVPAALRTQPVFNEYGLGGYLIYRGVKPFIDGRTDLYGDAFFGEYLRDASPDPVAFDTTLERYHIAWAILPTGHPLAAVLGVQPGWRRLYTDRYAVVYAREQPPAVRPSQVATLPAPGPRGRPTSLAASP